MALFAWLQEELNIRKHCARYRIGLWQCPQFLFVVMGGIIIVAVVAVYFAARRVADPEIMIVGISVLTAILFMIGHLIVGAFENVARASRSKSEFISIMSHQLRSPLSAIKWQLDVLNTDQLNGHPDQIEKYLSAMSYYSERMIHLVNDLLEVNRIEDNDIVLRPSVFSLATLTKNIMKRQEAYAAANNVRFVCEQCEGEGVVRADEDRVRKIIEHLLDNAIRYSVHGGIVIVSIEIMPEAIRWNIVDQGIGISPEEYGRIFEKFFRSQNITRHQTAGSGVGLFIVKSLVERLGGAVGFQSEVNKGSTFWFTLPLKNGVVPESISIPYNPNR